MELDEKVYRLISATRKEMIKLKKELDRTRAVIAHNMESNYACPVCKYNEGNPFNVTHVYRGKNNEYMQRYVRCKNCDSSILQIITNIKVIKEGDKHVNGSDNIRTD